MTDRDIVVRNLHFSLDPSMPRYWLGGNRALSMFLDHLSLVFPPGERFFMNSVRYFEKNITEPELKAAVRAFHAQEALHGREHASYNELLRTRGYPVDAVDQSAKGILGFIQRVLPKRWQLAVTVSLEHFTALLAQFLLADDSILENAPPSMAAIWRWHAAEENEHAAVAFDVYKAVGGNYPERVVVMIGVTIAFWYKMIKHQAMMMRADGSLFSAATWRQLLHFAFVSPGVFPRIWRDYLAYFKPSFHPHELDCTNLLARWKDDYSTSPVYVQSVVGPARAS